MDFNLAAFVPQYGLPMSLIGLFVWLIFTGKLVPKSTVDQIIADKDKWQQTADTYQKRADLLYESTIELARSSTHTSNQFLEKLPRLETDVEAANTKSKPEEGEN